MAAEKVPLKGTPWFGERDMGIFRANNDEKAMALNKTWGNLGILGILSRRKNEKHMIEVANNWTNIWRLDHFFSPAHKDETWV